MLRATIYCPCYTEFEDFITGHHIYKAISTSTINEELIREPESENEFHRYAIKVVKSRRLLLGMFHENLHFRMYIYNHVWWVY